MLKPAATICRAGRDFIFCRKESRKGDEVVRDRGNVYNFCHSILTAIRSVRARSFHTEIGDESGDARAGHSRDPDSSRTFPTAPSAVYSNSTALSR